jgi:LPXTG-motif cell wall-anchored protein
VKVALLVVAVLLLLIGGAFAGQGLGYIPGSIMTGDIHWFWIGSGMVVVGLVVGAGAVLRRRKQA